MGILVLGKVAQLRTPGQPVGQAGKGTEISKMSLEI